MNRRELIKAISSLAVTLIAPIMFARKAVRRIVPITLYNVDKVSIQDLEDALDDGALEEVYERFRDRSGERSPNERIFITFSSNGERFYPAGFRKLFGEGICNICHRNYKVHSSKEFGDCAAKLEPRRTLTPQEI